MHFFGEYLQAIASVKELQQIETSQIARDLS